MKIYIASDHGGYEYKQTIIDYLSQKGHRVEDMGNKEMDPKDDYPDFIIPLAEKVAQNRESIGIVLGRSGNGEAIAANKVKGIRAALCLDTEMTKKARIDNNANILALGADYVEEESIKEIINVFIETAFSGEEKHLRRIEKISNYETTDH